MVYARYHDHLAAAEPQAGTTAADPRRVFAVDTVFLNLKI
jgi:hypothetical protein